jgi:hypothetical protein
MIALGTPATARLQSQVGEALSVIAAQDFPENWEGLCDVSDLCRVLLTAGNRRQSITRQFRHQQWCPSYCSLYLWTVSSFGTGSADS